MLPARWVGLIAAGWLLMGSHPAWSTLRAGLPAPIPVCPWEKVAKRFPALFVDGQRILVAYGSVSLPLTFSYDTELSPGEMVVAIRNGAPDLYAQLMTELGADYSLPELAQILGKSPAQIRTFAIAAGETPDTTGRYNLAQLHGKYIDEVLLHLLLKKKDKSTAYRHRDKVAGVFQEMLTRGGMQMDYAPEGDGSPEFVHPSYERDPTAFGRQIGMLHQAAPGAQTHLHLGLPAAVIATDQAVLVTQALETRMILRLAARDHGDGQLAFHQYTALRKGGPATKDKDGTLRYEDRGITKLMANRFSHPSTHDLEIRFYKDITEGMEYVAFAAELARNHTRLRKLPRFPRSKVEDRATGNLSGALRYAGLQFKAAGQHGDIAKELIAFSDRIERAGKITSAMRKEVYDYLRENDVPALLDTAAFLTP